MMRKMKITRIAALVLAIVLFFNNEQVLNVLAAAVENPAALENQNPDSVGDTGTCEHEWVTDSEDPAKEVCNKCGEVKQADNPEPEEPEPDPGTDIPEECEHEWVTAPEDPAKEVCSKCGEVKQTGSPEPEEPEPDPGTDIPEECEHEWVTDPEDPAKVVCSKCGKEQQADSLDPVDPDIDTDITEECEHEWTRDPETLQVICSICREYHYDYVEEDECPEGNFHVYQLKEDSTGYVCAFCGAEKEVLDALDVTLEMYINYTNGQIDLLDADDPDSIDYSKLPKTLADLSSYDSNEIIVSSLGDLLAVQQLSQQTDLAGYKIQILRRTVKDSIFPSETWDLRGTAFTGLGTDDLPFRGELYSGFDGLLYRVDHPFFQYLSTDAVVRDMRIQGRVTQNTTDPEGILAGVLVKGKDSETSIVTMDGVVINGIDGVGVSNSLGAAGMVFGRVDASAGKIELAFSSDQLRFCSEQAAVSGLHVGGLAGETIGDVSLEIKDPGVTGNVIVRSYVGTYNGGQPAWEAGAGGMYIGAMRGGTLTIAGNAAPYTVNVERADSYGGINGGFVGMAIGTVVETTSASDSLITVSSASGVVGNKGVVGRTAGGVLGYYESTDTASDLNLEYITVNTNVSALNNYYAGGILGHYYRNVDNGDYETIDYITVNSEVAANNLAGGVIGYVQGSYLKIGSEENDSSIAFSGTVTGNSTSVGCGSGGIAGCIRGKYVEIRNAKVTATSAFHGNAYASGGIVGQVGKDGTDTIIKIKDVDVDVIFNINAQPFARYRGGLLGWVDKGSMVSLDGKNQIRIRTNGNEFRTFEQFGNIAGYQNDALIYLEEDAENTLVENTPGNFYTRKDDIGNYGGVYRNDARWKENGENLFSYEQGKVTGEVWQQGGKWMIDSEADFIRLAVMLNSDGRFAANCFVDAAKTALLSAEYSITKNLDLTDSGIYSLNRNDKITKSDEELFKGKFIGNNVTIDLGTLETRQKYLALFPTVGDGAEVSGFTLNRAITGGTLYGAGIACKAYGNFTAQNLTLNVNITAYVSDWYWGYNGSDINSTRYYGGLVSQVEAQGATTLTVHNVKTGGSFTNTENLRGVYGGMAADYSNGVQGTKSVISVDGYELQGTFNISAQRYSSGMITRINSSVPLTEDRTILSMKDIQIHDGASIVESYSDNDSSSEIGGWLGLFWRAVVPDENVHYSIQNVVIGDGNDADAGPRITSNSDFAGLVTNIAGRIQLKDIDIKNAVFANAASGRDRNIGLLFFEGLSALIEIDGYRIDKCEIGDTQGASAAGVSHNGKVKVTGRVGNFDEIVVWNTNYNNNINYDYTTGGIVNVIYDGFSDAASAEHNTYQDRLFPTHQNIRTRYYYNLFGNSFAGESNFLSDAELLTQENTVITNERQMMIWHLSQYMSGNILRFIGEYYVDRKINVKNADITFKGNIDLAKVSYYPTSVTGGTYNFVKDDSGAASQITFYGKEITDKAGRTSTNSHMKPSVVQGTHYMMHSGLFLSNGGKVTVQGDEGFLTLTGSISKVLNGYGGEPRSGALFTGEISGEKKIYKIRLKDLYVADYDGSNNSDHSAGLLIGKINDDSDLDISWIETTENYQIPTTQQHAAAALIGIVGDPKATDITIEFTNLKLDSRKDGHVFKWASLIDRNYYLEDRTTTVEGNNRLRRIRYLFTEYAFTGDSSKAGPYAPFEGDPAPVYGNNGAGTYSGSYVTIGRELEDGIEFWDNSDGPVDNTVYDLPFNSSGFTWGYADNPDPVGNSVGNTYLPYVHTDSHEGCKEIEVNPKNLGILKGCGTYEDPYQIEDAKQILALARYLQNKNDYKYLGGWQINDFKSGRMGGTPDICAGQSSDNHEHIVRTYPMNGDFTGVEFPSQEELSQAYYVITEDIDLSNMRNTTDKQIAEDFIGLGTPNIPFRGVIIGNKQADGTFPTITLPVRLYWTDGVNGTTDTNHGLIQYAKGAVVKDLNIVGGTDRATGNPATSRTGVAKVSDMAGGVIACVLGGDNIIDNVTVKLKVALVDTSCQAGAYVGNVKQGSVILRNLKESSASQFHVGTWRGNRFISLDAADAADGEKLENYPYVSGLIGKVEDGCVIYEDDFKSGESCNTSVLAHDSLKITNDSGTCIYSNDKLPICKHYDIIVNSKLNKNDKIKMTSSDGMNFTADVTTNAQLQIVSMAINSDAFSIYYGEVKDGKREETGGYDDRTSCRKADYDATGLGNSTNTSTGSDWNLATANDDAVYYYPYLYDYFDFSGVTNGRMGTLQEDASGSGNYTSKLNAATEEITAIMNYELLNNKTYDMSVYDRGFRGLGATYGMLQTTTYSYHNATVSADAVIGNSFYSDFRANFSGNGATINLGIDRSYDQSIHTAALFNDLLYRNNTKDPYTIQNFTVTGNVASVDKDADGNVTTNGNSAYLNRTAAVVGLMRQPWVLEDITVKDMTIEAKGHAAGVAAWIEPESGTAADPKNFTFNNCSIEGNTEIHSYGGSVGGVIGVMTQHASGSAITNVQLNLNGCTVKGTDAGHMVDIEVKGRTAFNSSWYNNFDSITRYVQYATGRSGGLIGYIGPRYAGFDAFSPTVTIADDNGSTGSKPTRVEHARIVGAYSTGGLVGEYDAVTANYTSWNPNYTNNESAKVTIDSAQVKNCEIEGTGSNYKSNSNNTPDDGYNAYGVGGLIGEMRGYELKLGGSSITTSVTNTNISSSSEKMPILNTSNTLNYGMYTGGVVGSLSTRKADITNVSVKGDLAASPGELELGGQQYTIKSVRTDAGGVIGRAGFSLAPELTMSKIQVSGMNITVGDWKLTADDKRVFETKNGAGGYAGGVIGRNEMSLTISGSGTLGSGAAVSKCLITAAGSSGNAGGIIGGQSLYQNATRTCPTNIADIKVSENIIGYNNRYLFKQNNLTVGAGGVYGRLYGGSDSGNNYYINHQLENAEISGCWIYGYNAGGVLGYGDNHLRLFSNEQESETSIVAVKNNNIYGIVAGGAIGYCLSSAVHYIGTDILNNHLQAYINASDRSASVGGFAGYVANGNSSAHDYRLDFITLSENDILAANVNNNKMISAGGFFGYSNWTNCYVYRPELVDNLIGYSESDNGSAIFTEDETTVVSISTLQKLFNSTDGEISKGPRTVNLIEGTASSALRAVAMPTVNQLKANTIGHYAGRIGNFIGTYGTDVQTYFLAPEISYKDARITTRPVIDVGMAAGTTDKADAALLDAPYAYREKIHIIYHDAETETTIDDDAKVWNNLNVDNVSTGNGNWTYLFNGISYENIIENYQKAEGDSCTVFEYLDAYRLGVKAEGTTKKEGGEYNIAELYEILYKNDKGELLTTLKSNGTPIPMIVLDTQYGKADELIKGVVAALTDIGGVYNSDANNVYSAGMGAVTSDLTVNPVVSSITVTPMQINDDGSIAKRANVEANLVVSGNQKRWTIDYNGYDSDGSLNPDETKTFTLLTIKYNWTYSAIGDSNNKITRQEEINIPIFVVERLNIDTHFKIIGDLVYNADNAKENGVCSAVTIANDSSYTIYSEYIYDEVRKKYDGLNIGIDKQIGMSKINETGREQVGFAPGTKLTLIDICDNNKVYYYTVGENDTGPYSYELFEDADGNPYKNKDISEDDGFETYENGEKFKTYEVDKTTGARIEFEYTDVAVERFLINVDTSGVVDKMKPLTGKFSVTPKIPENLAPRTTLEEHTDFLVTMLEGMTISFYGKDQEDDPKNEKTWITGKIQADEDGFADIWATINIHADQVYWTSVAQDGNAIDSANRNKYLELQVYLSTENSDQEILLPNGTNVVIDALRTEPSRVVVSDTEGKIEEDRLDTYTDASGIYFYKDGNRTFELDDLVDLILEEIRLDNYNHTDGTIRWVDHLKVDFRNADMTPYDLEHYKVNLRLLRIEDAAYPGGGEVMDSYSRSLPAASKQSLACAVEAKDLMQLGINIYENQTKMPHAIDFDFKLNFEGILTQNEATDKVNTDQWYTVVYRILEKQYDPNGELKYVAYNGDQISLELVDAKQNEVLKPATSKDNLKCWYVGYRFAWDEIKNGTKYQVTEDEKLVDKQETGVVVRSLKLTVNDAAEMDLSNYKVQAVVYVNKPALGAMSPELINLEPVTTELIDFFVFTVAKLKTDLDY